ncbi:MAG: triose-phosphate isomerase [Firmicutes bacterium]|uniref:Triosephosphate isomerase n=1 Tax=Candidatus Stercoripulliclostridium pullicola TaxID=2840953 RepID=A0A940DGW8_9FIRM|nr:triose-phosphate isomerase [Candidatus Stercoripulliclostridium pullicola]
MKRPIIAGNWKMNNTNAGTKALLTELAPLVKDAKCEVVVCVPFTDIDTARKAIRGTKIKLGAQNVHWAPKGAFTGEISAEMLKELKVEYVIVGHSERRQYFGETDASVNARVKAAVGAGLKAIICVGETLEEREAGKTNEVVTRQINGAFEGLEKIALKSIVVAYEPVWAIGTGKTATAQDANDTIAVIRKALRKLYGRTAANAMRIQYGGSMNPKNASELMAMPEIDGGLIGGASLKAEDFAKVVNY